MEECKPLGMGFGDRDDRDGGRDGDPRDEGPSRADTDGAWGKAKPQRSPPRERGGGGRDGDRGGGGGYDDRHGLMASARYVIDTHFFTLILVS